MILVYHEVHFDVDLLYCFMCAWHKEYFQPNFHRFWLLALFFHYHLQINKPEKQLTLYTPSQSICYFGNIVTFWLIWCISFIRSRVDFEELMAVWVALGYPAMINNEICIVSKAVNIFAIHFQSHDLHHSFSTKHGTLVLIHSQMGVFFFCWYISCE